MSQPSKPPNPAEPAKAPPGFVSGGADPAGAPDQGGAPDPVGAAAIAPEAVERIERLAAGYLDSIVAMAVGSPEYGRAVAAIDHLGERDFVATAAMSGRLLDRRFLAMRGLLAAKAPLARQLADLRKAAAELDPTRIKLGGRRSSRDEMAELDRYFERFARSQPRLEALLASLTEGRLALEQDNAAIVAEQASLATEMETLRQYAFLAGRIDEKLAALIDEIAGTDDVPRGVAAPGRPACRETAAPGDPHPARRGDPGLPGPAHRRGQQRGGDSGRGFGHHHDGRGAAHGGGGCRRGCKPARGPGAARDRRSSPPARWPTRRPRSRPALSGPGGRVEMLRGAWAEVYAALDRVDAQKARVLKTMSSADLELARPKSVSADRSGEDSRAPGADASLRLR